MLQRIKYIHEREFLHRDIKPDNFTIGIGENINTIYMIDYGLAKKFVNKQDHIPYRDDKNLTGTARYASITTHLGIEQGRRDDLESLGYVLIYFLSGSLPWQQSFNIKNKFEKYNLVMEKKLSISLEMLCK